MIDFLSRLYRRNTDPKKELQKVLGTYTLPSFSTVVLSTLERIRDPEATPSAIGDMLSADPGLSVRILGSVNSAAYAVRREVKSVEHGVALLGIPAVESLILSVEVVRVAPRQAAPGYDHPRFWRAAARRAAIARALAAVLHPALVSESFTAALLQDMAIPFLATQQGERYGPVLEQWHAGGESLAVLEQQEFGWNHAEVATWLGSEWSLPDSLVEAIGGHHGAVSEGTQDLECPPAVSLVSHIRETEEELGIDKLLEAAHSEFGMPTNQVEELINGSLESAEELARQFT
jgi:HD-like signal output (HDOD) protein